MGWWASHSSFGCAPAQDMDFPREFFISRAAQNPSGAGRALCASCQAPEGPARLMDFLLTASGAKWPTDTTGAAGKCIWQWKTGNVTGCTKCRSRKAETLILKNTTWKRCSFWKLILLHQIIKEENIVKIIKLSFYTATVFYLRFPLRPAVMVAWIKHVSIWSSFH